MHLPVQQSLLILIAAGYLIGSIPFGLFVGLAKGVDVRKAGSGNIGASNVGRLLGKKYFFFVMGLDLLKSLVPMLIASWIVRGQLLSPGLYGLWLGVGLAAILGHMFSIYLKFKGGKGVATSGGVLLGLYPYYTAAGVITILAFIVAFLIFRYISVGSMTAAVTFPIAYFVIGEARGWGPLDRQWPLLVFGIVICLLVLWKHRTNIARLRAGTEHRATKTVGTPTA